MFDPIYVRPNQYQYGRNPFVNAAPIRPDDARAIAPDYAGEMARRASDLRSDIERRAAAEREHQSLLRVISSEVKEYDALKAKFAKTYADFDLAEKLTVTPTEGDNVAFSKQAKAYLSDLAALEKKRERTDNLTEYAAREARELPGVLERFETMTEMAAAGWDLRYAPTDGQKIEAWNKFNEAGNRGAMLGAEAEYANAQRQTRDAAVKAGAAALTEGLSGAALFKVADNGRIDFDTKGLEHLSPGAQAAAQLKRLVEIMSVRNGFSPLRGAVAKALDIQNAYIASHPVVAAATVELPF